MVIIYIEFQVGTEVVLDVNVGMEPDGRLWNHDKLELPLLCL